MAENAPWPGMMCICIWCGMAAVMGMALFCCMLCGCMAMFGGEACCQWLPVVDCTIPAICHIYTNMKTVNTLISSEKR